VSADSNATTHINVHVLSDLIVRSFYSAAGVDADNAFANPVVSSNAAPTPLAVQTVANTVIQAVQLWLTNAGVTVTAGTPTSGSINLISSAFTANNTGLDSVLHATTEAVNSGTGAVTTVTVTNGTITETANLTYSGGAITVNTTTTNSSTGATSTESIGGIAPTTAQLTALNAIAAQFTAFESAVNKNSSTLSVSVVAPFFAPDYLNDGDTAAVDEAGLVADLTGATLNSIQITAKSVNTTTNTADVIETTTLTEGGQTQTGTQEFILKEESGTWLIYGDQRVAQVTAQAESRSWQGGVSGTNGPAMTASVDAPTGAVTGATVSGTPSIWPSGGGSATSGTLLHQSSLIQNGQSYDQYILLSNFLGTIASALPAAGSQFTFHLTTAASGNPSYTVPTNAFTTEIITFSGISGTPNSGPLSSVLNKTDMFHWSLPGTYSTNGVSLFAYILDGSPISSTTHSCSISSTSALALTATSGSIAIPANMSACGLSSADAIAFVQVFLEVTGTNGEDNLVELLYPY